jgi:hypothetical protein
MTKDSRISRFVSFSKEARNIKQERREETWQNARQLKGLLTFTLRGLESPAMLGYGIVTD